MKIIAHVLLVLLAFGPVAEAAVPVCVLGGPTAMDPKRQLAEGETFVVTDRPLVVNLRFRPTKEHPEQVGECMLPSGTKVAQKGGFLVWVAACGNDEVNRNILVAPVPVISSIQAPSQLDVDVNVHHDGEVTVNHKVSGTLILKHEGAVALTKTQPESKADDNTPVRNGGFPWKNTIIGGLATGTGLALLCGVAHKCGGGSRGAGKPNPDAGDAF